MKRMEILMGKEKIDRIEFQLNGRTVKLEVEADRKLLWVLRTDLNLPGTKYACGQGLCGACTVLIEEEAQRSCQVPVREVAGKRVVTIEGLAQGEKLHPLQKAFLEHNAFQCGYCTPGMILNAHSLLKKNSHPSEGEIIRAMDGNLCRCGAHPRIVAAIQTAARQMKEKKG
jgi:carbon-monoxide dehydrogenase small subunit